MKEGTNYIALCITLTIAVFLGNGMILVVEKAWTNYEWSEAARVLQKSTERINVESAQRMKERQIKNKKALIQRQEQSRLMKIQSEKDQNAQRISRQTCDFWGAEYRKSRTSYNKAMMDSACNRQN
jgi:hypothetical protein